MNGTNVPFPSGSTIIHTGFYDEDYNPKRLIEESHSGYYYCSDVGSFIDNTGDEQIIVRMPSAVSFDGFMFVQESVFDDEEDNYSPKSFNLFGMGSSGAWVLLHAESNLFWESNASPIFAAGWVSA